MAAHAAGQLTFHGAHAALVNTQGEGERVQVMINVADAAELNELDPAESDGIGLVRTELLFHGRERLPDEEEQFRATVASSNGPAASR